MNITKQMLKDLGFLQLGGLYQKQYSKLLKLGLIKTQHPVGRDVAVSYLNSCITTKLGKKVLKAAEAAALKAANDEFSCYFRNFS